MHIKINEEIDQKKWNDFCNNKTFFKFEWFYIIKNSYNLKPLFILCYDDKNFSLIASFKTPKGYISLPFVSYSGYLSNNDSTLSYLKNYLKESHIEIDSRDLCDEEVTEGYVNPIVYFDNLDSFWSNISSNNRNQFKKSFKFNYEFIEENNIENFYNLYATGMRNLGTPVHGKKYFNQIQKFMTSKVFTIMLNNKAIGSMFCLLDNDSLSVNYAYVYPEYSKDYANYFMYYKLIEWMSNNSIKILDMGRSTYDEGTFHFKKKFKPKFYKISSNINYSQNNTLKIFSEIWTKIPLCLANFIGPKLRRFLP